MRGDSATVVIIGAGPAGLVLGNLLLAEGVDCVIVERQSRAHIEERARAGFLAANSVRVLDENGLAAGLHKHGQPHDACSFRSEVGQFELNYGKLGRGEIHTVYPQQNLVRDLLGEFIARGGDVRFELAAVEVNDIESDNPWISCRAADGALHRLACRFVAGCDGQHGIAAQAVPDAAAVRYRREHGVSWLAILAQAPQSMPAVTYAIHARGFAGHMARSPTVTRYYLQCQPDDAAESWSDEYIWDELHRRFRAEQYGNLVRGPIIERGVVDMCSIVVDPMQHGRLFLVGDAASLIGPSAAKGANLAIMAAEVLAKAMITYVRYGDERPLERYSAECLPRIWRAQEFSHWMINLLHGPAAVPSGESTFLSALQRSRLESLQNSRSHQDFFAENYVGI